MVRKIFKQVMPKISKNNPKKIDINLVLNAYKKGIFPMAEDGASSEIYWVEPEMRGIIDLAEFKIPKSLKKKLKNNPFKIEININFKKVIESCAKSMPGREQTWINPIIKNTFIDLHDKGHAHSVECYEKEELVGGLYGVAIGGVFFGESMFSFKSGTSKIALVHLVERLKYGGFSILDTQFLTKHLESFGAKEIKKEDFINILNQLVNVNSDFFYFGSKRY